MEYRPPCIFLCLFFNEHANCEPHSGLKTTGRSRLKGDGFLSVSHSLRCMLHCSESVLEARCVYVLESAQNPRVTGARVPFPTCNPKGYPNLGLVKWHCMELWVHSAYIDEIILIGGRDQIVSCWRGWHAVRSTLLIILKITRLYICNPLCRIYIDGPAYLWYIIVHVVLPMSLNM